ncbi:glycerol-3-phosphate phosphatase isoform X1 [Aplysia californica]|uniref:Glycerol-3-phosphate phosphatase isoform X1 n=1 Tax=Aplysia californica TaxID=6500 RepID=A0ABM0JNR8_APLCA|nr:glycerol-3-phosphate phosphatase isoform X1 [Aplysia californica]
MVSLLRFQTTLLTNGRATLSFTFKSTILNWKPLIPLNHSLFRFERKQLSSLSSSNMAQLINEAKAKDLIENVDTFLFDCDGVLWDGHGMIEGSLETLLKLKELGKKVFYVTNNSSKSRQHYLDRCKQLGFPAEKEEIVCTAYIAAAYLKKIQFEGTVYLIGKPDSLGEELSQVGIKYVGTGPDPVEGVVEDWLKMSVNPEVKCVLVGFDPHISYMKIMKAATYLKNPNCLYLATNEDANLPAKGDVIVPGTGCMVVTVTHAAKRSPEIMGKPEAHMFEVLQQAHGLDPSRCLMVGDSLTTDMKFAKNCGMRSLLVLSGIATLEELNSKDAPSTPELYAPRLDELLKYI